MLCENCGKKEANVRYTEVINGNKKEMHLCEECSKKLGIEEMNFNMPSLDFSSFFGDLLNEYEESNFLPNLIKENIIKCNKCGMTFDEFTNVGKLGCDECYNMFSDKIDSILKNIHGDNRYLGKKAQKINEKYNNTDSSKTKNNRIDELKEKLKQLIKEEKYEEAAKVRDEIKKESD